MPDEISPAPVKAALRLIPSAFEALGPAFFTHLQTTPLPSPYWVGVSTGLADEMGISLEWLASDQALHGLSGNLAWDGVRSLASVYSGHQFGVWAGQLGDGRAILLGQTDGGLEIQLKGAGRTPYSRMGDGRAVLRSSIREFLCSETMHALHVPTTRALCVTGSDAPVYRENVETASVVTRAARSFVRFGHFEHFSYLGQHDALRALADQVIALHFPECLHCPEFEGNPYAALLQAVSERTARLLAHWQSVGFCHGVMNTDNMSILGLTIDYGPFQFLDAFVPGHICNHSDNQGRYAYNRQPQIAYWNLYCLGQALLPLIDSQEQAVAALESYKTVFPAAMEACMRSKLGLPDDAPLARETIERILGLLARDKVDYTIFWRRLSAHRAGDNLASVRDLFLTPSAFDDWLLLYSEQTKQMHHAETGNLMLKTNPKFVLRNHLGEQAIRAAKQKDFSELAKLMQVLTAPFDEHPDMEHFADFPPDWAAGIEISCSS